MKIKFNKYFNRGILKSVNEDLIGSLVRAEIYALAFLIPFGHWQEAVLGKTVAFYIAIISLGLILILPGYFKFSKLIFLPLLFVFFTLPSLYISPGYFSVLISFFGYILLMILIASAFTNISHYSNFARAYFFGVVIVSILVVLVLLTDYEIGHAYGKPLVEYVWGLPRVLGTEANPNAFSMYYIFGIVLAIHYFSESKLILGKVLYFFVFILMLAVLFFTYSRASGLATFIACILYFVFKDNQVEKKILYASALIIFLIPISIITLQSDLLISPENKVENYLMHKSSMSDDKGGLLADKSTSSGYRLEIIKIALDVWKDNFLFGVGFGQLKSEIVKKGLSLNISAHNIFIGIAVEYGVFALSTFLMFIVLLSYKYVRVIRKFNGLPAQSIFSVISASFFGFLVNGLFHENYVNVLLWLIIAIMMAVVCQSNNKYLIH